MHILLINGTNTHKYLGTINKVDNLQKTKIERK